MTSKINILLIVNNTILKALLKILLLLVNMGFILFISVFGSKLKNGNKNKIKLIINKINAIRLIVVSPLIFVYIINKMYMIPII